MIITIASVFVVISLALIATGILVTSIFLLVNRVEPGALDSTDYFNLWAYTIVIPLFVLIFSTALGGLR